MTTVAENEENIREIVRIIQTVNPSAPIVLTLSPVPLLATFRDMSCMTADCVSKSVLRVALDNVMADRPENVYYWPSFELVKWAGSALDWRAWGEDARHAHRYLVQCIINEFVESFYGPELGDRLRRDRHQLAPPHPVRRRLRRAGGSPGASEQGRAPGRAKWLMPRSRVAGCAIWRVWAAPAWLSPAEPVSASSRGRQSVAAATAAATFPAAQLAPRRHDPRPTLARKVEAEAARHRRDQRGDGVR